MTESKAFKWIGLLNLIILICIMIFRLRDNLLILSLLVVIPNLFAILVINHIEKKHKNLINIPDSIKNLLQIDSITKTGFDIYKSNKKQTIKWNDVISVYLDKNKTKLIITLKNKKIQIPKNSINWYKLIRSIPVKYTDFDFDYIDKLFNSLTTCEICGAIANRDNECLLCGSESFDYKKHSEFKTKNDYIKENQLELFAILDGDDKFEGFYEATDGFEIDRNWRPLITETELLEYIKNEYWND
ncbi:MAG: hypothetical protein Q8S18_05885 [Bacteroidales bacterium]|nr:hypothetical protein [Bacteroidales bacterium]